MKAEELMIGNWVSHIPSKNETTNAYFKVSDIRTFNESTINGLDVEDCEPIPLTEYILLKCGFEPYKDISHEKKIGEVTLDIYKDLSWSIGIPYEANGTDIKIHYLHQLQNLYFILSNEHLKIEL